jgi:hypothetical protein
VYFVHIFGLSPSGQVERKSSVVVLLHFAYTGIKQVKRVCVVCAAEGGIETKGGVERGDGEKPKYGSSPSGVSSLP